MTSVLSKLKKLRGRSPDELRVRGAQAAAAFAERRGWSKQVRLSSDAELLKLLDGELVKGARGTKGDELAAALLEHFRTRRAPHFFPSFEAPAETRRALAGRYGESHLHVVETAERILAGRFSLLGFGELEFGRPVDWHLEPVAHRRAPLTHWSRIEYLNPQVVGDKKIIWELSRQQYLSTLGRAYWRTGDERYAEAFAAHLDAWMDANPPKLGINWASSLEVAFRSVSWLWAFYFFRDAAAFTPSLFLRACKFLYLHARHLETYLSTYFSPNTHLTGEALGLFYLGLLLPEFKCAARWRETGARILNAEAERQVRPDGVYFEQASYYQRYTADFYTHYLLLARANDIPVAQRVRERLAALFEHLSYITRPDGRATLYGDDDGGRLVFLDERPTDDFRAALSNGATMFARADFKYVAGEAPEETLWLTGARGLEAFDHLRAHEPRKLSSRAFADGGFYLMRDGWQKDSNYLLLDCGLHGALNCGHAHSDALSFELAARGRTLLVDAGTYTYTGDRAARDLFRSSAMHNTLTVDGQSASEPGGAFQWKHVAQASARRWTTHERFDYFEGTHDGYKRLDAELVYARSVLFLKDDYWVMRDTVTGARQPHLYELHFHFAPEAETSTAGHREESPAAHRLAGHRAEPRAEAAASGLRSVMGETALDLFVAGEGEGRWREEAGWVSRRYGERRRAPHLVYAVEAAGERPQQFFTFLLPRAAVETTRRDAFVRQLEAAGGDAFEIAKGEADEGRRDLLLVRAAGAEGVAVSLDDGSAITSDFEWAWMRLGRDGAALEELVLIGGRRFAFDGCEVVDFPGRVAFAVVRRERSVLHVETEAGKQQRELPAPLADPVSSVI